MDETRSGDLVFISINLGCESKHASKFLEVKHGRNHLITYQLCEPLRGARETTNNNNGSQGILVQSMKCENMY